MLGKGVVILNTRVREVLTDWMTLNEDLKQFRRSCIFIWIKNFLGRVNSKSKDTEVGIF